MDKVKYLLMTGVLMLLPGTAVIELSAESIQVGDYTGNVGDIIMVNVTFKGTDISGVSFDLSFDNTRLCALNVTEGSFMKNACSTTFNAFPPEINNTLGTINFYNFCWGERVSVSGVIASITFNVTRTGRSDLRIKNLTVFDMDGNPANKNFTMDNGTINAYPCDLNHDGLIIHDYVSLIAAYRCFLGINEKCNSINVQDWNLMKSEYNCFTGNFN